MDFLNEIAEENFWENMKKMKNKVIKQRLQIIFVFEKYTKLMMINLPLKIKKMRMAWTENIS